MSERSTDRALDEPLTDSELDELEAFLASDAVPQDCMDLEMLDGFLAAMLEGVKSERGNGGGFGMTEDAEHAALLA